MDTREHLPDEFTSLEAVQEFWDHHSSADFEADMEDVEMELTPALKLRLEARKIYRHLGLSRHQIDLLEERARQEQIDSRKLVASWVVQHLEEPSAA